VASPGEPIAVTTKQVLSDINTNPNRFYFIIPNNDSELNNKEVKKMTQLTLKQWMAVRDMTVLQFADAIGVSYPTVSNWRVGNTKPNAKYIPVIEKTLGIDYKDIIWK